MARQTVLHTTPIYGENLVRYIYAGSVRRGLDPAAVLSIVPHEGGFFGAVGDNGTSFGPFQLHRGGALPSTVKDPKRWANSMAGVDYALDAIQRVAGKARGQAAITAIAYQFERPANPAAEVAKASASYPGISSALKAQRFNLISGRGTPPSGTTGGGVGGAVKSAVVDAASSIPTIGPIIGGASVAGGGNPIGGVKSAVEGVTDIAGGIGWIFHNWDRMLEVLAGGILVGVGLFLLGRQMMGRDTDLSKLVAGQVTASAREQGFREGVSTGRNYEDERAAAREESAAARRADAEERRANRRAASYRYDPATAEVPF